MINDNAKNFEILIGGFGEGYFKVDFPGRFNEQMLDAVRKVPGRKWNNDVKLWLIPELKAHIEKIQELHKRDVADGWGSVTMPGALAGKYPAESKEFKWQWLFPQKKH